MRNITESIPLVRKYFLPESVKKGKPEKINISFVGDSLSGQMFIGSGCLIERYGYFHNFNLQFILSVTLRNDSPCNDKCNDSAWRSEAYTFNSHACDGCGPNYTRVAYNPRDPRAWNMQLQDNVNVVVVGSGEWYKNFNFPDEDYLATMQLVKPILKELIARGVLVVWLPLPYVHGGDPKYQWDYYEVKNEMARHTFADIDVLYFDMNKYTRSRMRHGHQHNCRKKKKLKNGEDGAIMYNMQIHYNNPRATSMNVVMFETMMHFISLKLTDQ